MGLKYPRITAITLVFWSRTNENKMKTRRQNKRVMYSQVPGLLHSLLQTLAGSVLKS